MQPRLRCGRRCRSTGHLAATEDHVVAARRGATERLRPLRDETSKQPEAMRIRASGGSVEVNPHERAVAAQRRAGPNCRRAVRSSAPPDDGSVAGPDLDRCPGSADHQATAELADGWLPTCATAEHLRSVRGELEQIRREAGVRQDRSPAVAHVGRRRSASYERP
jgi:hypothetical protein